jgi:ribosome-binding ATPase YchF (GTP1/OBG family)
MRNAGVVFAAAAAALLFLGCDSGGDAASPAEAGALAKPMALDNGHPLSAPTDDRSALGLEAPGLERLIHASYRLLDLVTFFTATGTNVVRAWTLRRGQTVYEAAGKIHTDMQRGFIRAEVVAYADLVRAGDLAHARDRGLLRLEGRDYQVQDGDVVHIRFSPPR